MFGELVIAYLFLAGVGAGAAAAASLADLLFIREPFGSSAVADFAEKRPAARLCAYAFAASGIAMGLSVACLAFDLGRLDRVLSLFLTPPFTLMNIGAWAITLLSAVSVLLTLVRVLFLPSLGRGVVCVLEVIAIALALVVAVYAGLLLQTLTGVRLWSSPWLPVLFTLSAASCGCAVVMASSLLVEGDAETATLVRRMAWADLTVIVLEAIAAALFVAFAVQSDHPGVHLSAERLMTGEAALPWWIGFIVLGCAVPLVMESASLMHARRSSSVARPILAAALAGVLVLVGAAGLRTAVVEAGAHRPPELQKATTAEDAEQNTHREDVGAWLS